MGIKKKCRELNKAKNTFVKWLKDNKAEDVDVFEGEPSDEWDYYRTIDAFIMDRLYVVRFMMWHGETKIDYSDEENRYNDLSIEEFLELIN